MTRGEFRYALDLAHQGIIQTGQGDSEALGALLYQIAEKAPERDPALDAAARRAYRCTAGMDVDLARRQPRAGLVLRELRVRRSHPLLPRGRGRSCRVECGVWGHPDPREVIGSLGRLLRGGGSWSRLVHSMIRLRASASGGCERPRVRVLGEMR